jgi:hypothetical protein
MQLSITSVSGASIRPAAGEIAAAGLLSDHGRQVAAIPSLAVIWTLRGRGVADCNNLQIRCAA